jgi:hypothetical protein
MIDGFRLLLIAAATVISLGSPSFAQRAPNDDLRTADEAKAMLAKAVAAVKADKAKALDMFNKGEGGFRDGNLTVACFNVGDGKFVATGNPNSKKWLGVDGRTFKDLHGSSLRLDEVAKKPDGEITVVDVELPKPGPDTAPSPKENYATKVGDLICSVGYFYWYNDR